jgi:hypothetical protein
VEKRGKRGGTSAFIGVSWDKIKKRWKAKIRANGKVLYLGANHHAGKFIFLMMNNVSSSSPSKGNYDTEEEAARKYDEKALPLGRAVNFQPTTSPQPPDLSTNPSSHAGTKDGQSPPSSFVSATSVTPTDAIDMGGCRGQGGVGGVSQRVEGSALAGAPPPSPPPPFSHATGKSVEARAAATQRLMDAVGVEGGSTQKRVAEGSGHSAGSSESPMSTPLQAGTPVKVAPALQLQDTSLQQANSLGAAASGVAATGVGAADASSFPPDLGLIEQEDLGRTCDDNIDPFAAHLQTLKPMNGYVAVASAGIQHASDAVVAGSSLGNDARAGLSSALPSPSLHHQLQQQPNVIELYEAAAAAEAAAAEVGFATCQSVIPKISNETGSAVSTVVSTAERQVKKSTPELYDAESSESCMLAYADTRAAVASADSVLRGGVTSSTGERGGGCSDLAGGRLPSAVLQVAGSEEEDEHRDNSNNMVVATAYV